MVDVRRLDERNLGQPDAVTAGVSRPTGPGIVGSEPLWMEIEEA
jgi:hypothetical protein